jgi:hypothetical protein
VTSSHKHGAKGNPALAGDVDARLAVVEAGLQAVAASHADLSALFAAHVAAPDPEPEPEPEPPTGTPAFLTRPVSQTISRSGGSSVVIENVAINGGTRDSVAGFGIQIASVNGTIVIRDVDLANLIGGIYLYNCTGELIIERVRMRNIGDGTIGAGRSNYIQCNQCTFRGGIRHSLFLGGRTEDMISLYKTGGAGAGAEFVVEDNRLQGLVTDTATARAWNSTSGTGIIIGDGVGDARNNHTIVRRNTFLTPGQVGIQHIDGQNIQTYENVIYGERRPLNNNPLTSYAGNPRGVVRDNRFNWTNENGYQPSPYLAYGSLVQSGNRFDASLDPATLRVVL